MLGLWLNITTHKMILLPYLLFFFYVHNVISLLIIVFFRLPCPPLAKRGSLTHSQALALSKRARDVTAPPVALNRCALRLAGHQSPRQVSYAGWDRLAESGASKVSPCCAGRNRMTNEKGTSASIAVQYRLTHQHTKRYLLHIPYLQVCTKINHFF